MKIKTDIDLIRGLYLFHVMNFMPIARQVVFSLSSAEHWGDRNPSIEETRLLFRMCWFNRASSSAMRAFSWAFFAHNSDAILFFDDGEK